MGFWVLCIAKPWGFDSPYPNKRAILHISNQLRPLVPYRVKTGITMQNFKELVASNEYQVVIASFKESQKQARTMESVFSIISKYWNGMAGCTLSYRAIFVPLGFNKPSELKGFLCKARDGKNAQVPAEFYDKKGNLCRCISSVVYDGKGKERTKVLDEEGNAVHENRYSRISSWSVKTVVDLLIQIDAATEGALCKAAADKAAKNAQPAKEEKKAA